MTYYCHTCAGPPTPCKLETDAEPECCIIDGTPCEWTRLQGDDWYDEVDRQYDEFVEKRDVPGWGG